MSEKFALGNSLGQGKFFQTTTADFPLFIPDFLKALRLFLTTWSRLSKKYTPLDLSGPRRIKDDEDVEIPDLSGAVVAVARQHDAGAAVGVAGHPGAVHREHHQQHQHRHHHDGPGEGGGQVSPFRQRATSKDPSILHAGMP